MLNLKLVLEAKAISLTVLSNVSSWKYAGGSQIHTILKFVWNIENGHIDTESD